MICVEMSQILIKSLAVPHCFSFDEVEGKLQMATVKSSIKIYKNFTLPISFGKAV
jgi:hypothetical protein